MKHLLSVLLCLITGHNYLNAQCMNPSSFNGSLNFSSTTTSIPNDMAPTGWNGISTPDQAKTGLEIDCATLPLVGSTNGGSWTRMADKVTAQEAIYRDISGFTIGSYYDISFEQCLVKNWGRSSGNVNVTLGTTTIGSPHIALPSGNPAQTSWQLVTVGHFLATATTMTLTLAAHSNQDGTGSSPMTGSCNGYDQNPLAADLMIDGITVCLATSLPVNFLSFELVDQNSVYALTWDITDPKDELEKFIVAKSNDLITWNTLGTVYSKSNDSYSFPIEFSYSSSKNYYKVSAYYKNNSEAITSTILSGNNKQPGESHQWLYNKESNEISTLASSKDRAVAIYDIRGNSIHEYFCAGNSIPTINVTAFPEGLYILLSNDEEQCSSFRFIR